MTNTDMNLNDVLAHHGYDVLGKSEDAVTDDMRAAGLIYACLGCGSVGGIDPANLGGHPDVETARRATRDHIDPDAFGDCCPDNTTIIF